MRSSLQDLVVVANREPYRHQFDRDGRLVHARSGSGVVNAVEPLLLAKGGVWIAEGVGAADRIVARDGDGLRVPPDSPRYRLRRVWLTDAERRGYYDGFANSALWPLCHRTSVEPTFSPLHFQAYDLVNRRFADAVYEEVRGPSPIVLVQDYHFALLPRLIRRKLPKSRVGTFWHIPWPRPETFEKCPWSRALLEGVLGSSALGFQTAEDRDCFLATVDRLLDDEVKCEADAVVCRGHTTAIGVFPVSVEWPGDWANAGSVDVCRREVRKALGLDTEVMLGVGVDRLDYSKGIEQKFLAVEWLLEKRPDLVGKFVFVQLAQPSRENIVAYRQTKTRIIETALRINRRFSRDHEGPIRLLLGEHNSARVARFFRAADLCYVGSLHDGMNLVCKEFVCAREDEQGALVLSSRTGAARELTDALIIDPLDRDAAAQALTTAIGMSTEEQRARMRRMRSVVARASAEHWASRVLTHVNDGDRVGRRSVSTEAVSVVSPM